MRQLMVALTVMRSAQTRSLVKIVMESAGHRVIESGGFGQAGLLLSSGLDPDLVLVESSLEHPVEISKIRELLQSLPAQNLCLVLGAGEDQLRHDALALGTGNVLTKPMTRRDLELVIEGLTPSEPQTACEDESVPCSVPVSIPSASSVPTPSVLQIEELGESGYFLAASPRMVEIHRQAKMLANADVNVLILGESGTGKEVIANLIHKHSRRSRYKLNKVNCAALPEHLLESELFGFRQGAFTGAIRDKQGMFEQAHRGTLLLDEIGEMGPHMQAKLLQVLQDGQFSRLGSEEPTTVDVRVIAATNIKLEAAFREKTFREDLYYRLGVFTINVPPLRERRAEIPYLIEETIRRAPNEMMDGGVFSFPSRLMDAVLQYEWRGNVRELRNFVTRTVVMRDIEAAIGELEAKLAEASREVKPEPSSACVYHSADMRTVVRDLADRAEARMIKEALDAAGWNRRHAAQHLNISYRGLLYKIQQHQLAPGQRP